MWGVARGSLIQLDSYLVKTWPQTQCNLVTLAAVSNPGAEATLYLAYGNVPLLMDRVGVLANDQATQCRWLARLAC